MKTVDTHGSGGTTVTEKPNVDLEEVAPGVLVHKTAGSPGPTNTKTKALGPADPSLLSPEVRAELEARNVTLQEAVDTVVGKLPEGALPSLPAGLDGLPPTFAGDREPKPIEGEEAKGADVVEGVTRVVK